MFDIQTKLIVPSFLSSIGEDENVAVKFLNCERAVEKLRPRQEIEILSDLNHPNVLRLIGAYEDEALFIQVFEFLRQATKEMKRTFLSN